MFCRGEFLKPSIFLHRNVKSESIIQVKILLKQTACFIYLLSLLESLIRVSSQITPRLLELVPRLLELVPRLLKLVPS